MAWNIKNETGPTTRMITRSGSMKRTVAEINQNGSVLLSTMVSDNHFLRREVDCSDSQRSLGRGRYLGYVLRFLEQL